MNIIIVVIFIVCFVSKWIYKDFIWVLFFFGIVVGVGVLFLFIKVGVGGFWLLVFFVLIVVLMIWFVYKFFVCFVLFVKNFDVDIIDMVEEYFGKVGVNFIIFVYFFVIYFIVLIYGVGIINMVDFFFVN